VTTLKSSTAIEADLEVVTMLNKDILLAKENSMNPDRVLKLSIKEQEVGAVELQKNSDQEADSEGSEAVRVY
jgi:hypothetical protein